MMIVLISMVMIVCIGIGILLYFFPKPPKRQKKGYDFALVLGCPCKEDGSLSRMQQRRMKHALTLYQQQAYRLLIVSGSSVKNEHNEAAAMLSYALQQQEIPHEAETKARNTFENFVYAKPLWEQHHCQTAIIITSPFHARRANYFAKRYFSDYCVSVYSEHDKLKHWPIEWFCMYKCLWCEIKIKRNNRKKQ